MNIATNVTARKKINKVLRLNNINKMLSDQFFLLTGITEQEYATVLNNLNPKPHNNMNNCPTIKEVTMPGCYSGVLKVNTGLAEGARVLWKLKREGGLFNRGGIATVDTDGNITVDGRLLSYFNSYILAFKNEALEDINIKGYDQYRLLPEKNTNEVIDVVI